MAGGGVVPGAGAKLATMLGGSSFAKGARLKAESPAIVPVMLTSGADALASPFAEELAVDEPFAARGAGSAALGDAVPQKPSTQKQTPRIERHAHRLCVRFCWDFSTQFQFRICRAIRARPLGD